MSTICPQRPMHSLLVIGIDTSCYTTSVAAADSTGIVFDKRTMLFVEQGQRGLRQSDGLFLHVKQLPPLVEALMEHIDSNDIAAVCVSEKPTDAEDSYMPVFLAGLGTARAVAASLHVPLLKTTHQRGHIRAAEIGNERLLAEEHFLALHLSGGTTDILSVRREDGGATGIFPLGRSTDLHVGQFVDRVGVALGMPFPAGKEMERLASASADQSLRIPAAVQGTDCSFSGAESQCQRLIASGAPREAIAYGVYDCIARTLEKMLMHIRSGHGNLPALLGGGVASSLLLRKILTDRGVENLYFANPAYASDNACGAALIGLEALL